MDHTKHFLRSIYLRFSDRYLLSPQLLIKLLQHKYLSPDPNRELKNQTIRCKFKIIDIDGISIKILKTLTVSCRIFSLDY